MIGERVFDSGVLGVEFGRNVSFGDAGEVVRKVVALEAKWADPDEGGEVDTTEGIKHGGAGLASEWSIGIGGDEGVSADRRDRGCDWNHTLASFNFCAWPGVPGHTNSVDSLWIGIRHLRRHLVCKIEALFGGFVELD